MKLLSRIEIEKPEAVYNLHIEKDHNYVANGAVVSNCHGASAKCVKGICENAVNAFQRIGMTGTLKNTEVHPLLVQGSFGPIQRIVTTKQLQDAGRAAQTMVTLMQLNYPTDQRQLVHEMDYSHEMEFLINHEYRNKIIRSLALTLEGNSLLMFERVDAHLEKVFEDLVAEGHENKRFFVINGNVKNEDRDRIKAATEAGNDIVILATWGTMSTGVSIKRLHNLVFCHPTKSIVRTLQTLGRMIRLHESKDVANIYDLVDDLTYRGRQNYGVKHASDRHSYYSQEQHRMKLHKIQMR